MGDITNQNKNMKTNFWCITIWILSQNCSYIMASSSSNKKEIILFDFTNENITKDVSDWYEVSDTVRTVGMSKATIVLQKTQVFRRAVLFALLNPQPNGAGFANLKDLMLPN